MPETTRLTLEAQGITCRRGYRTLFENLTFSVSAGECLALVGPNGSGKTSLLRILAGLAKPDAGTVTMKSEGPPYSGNVHYLAHSDGLKGALTALENLTFWKNYYGGQSDPVDALETLDILELAHLPASVLSAGQRRRVALCRLLVARRALWLMDEPTSALDAASEAVLGQIMKDHLAGGGLIVAATHGPLPVETNSKLDVSRAQITEPL
ncbi:MAG: heme ABC exporter ATP-binding protein CcmA [Pseudomonadota bacterium]